MSDYKWQVRKNTLRFHPRLHGCFTLPQVAARLRQEYKTWTVVELPDRVDLRDRAGRLKFSAELEEK